MSITITPFLVLLFAISDTSLPSPNRLIISPFSLHHYPSCLRISSCLASGASSPCLVLSYIFPPLRSLFLSSHPSDLFRLHLPDCWMTHIVQMPLFPSPPDLPQQHFTLLPLSIPYRLLTFLRSSLGPRSGLAVLLLLLTPHTPSPTLSSEHRRPRLQRLIPYTPYSLVSGTLPSSRSTFRSIDRLYLCSLTQLSRTSCVCYPP